MFQLYNTAEISDIKLKKQVWIWNIEKTIGWSVPAYLGKHLKVVQSWKCLLKMDMWVMLRAKFNCNLTLCSTMCF